MPTFVKKVLVACEESQRVTIELRKMGIEAYSCDILPCSGGYPEWHIQEDALKVLEEDWDMCIAFPPCTHLASSGARWFEQKRKDGRQSDGVNFFLEFTVLDHIPLVAIENPIGIMSNLYRKPDQIIHPWQFGDPFQKSTCLWLKGLPLLQHTEVLEDHGEFKVFSSGKKMPAWYSNNKDSKIRSKTFPGIARAMANQWGVL